MAKTQEPVHTISATGQYLDYNSECFEHYSLENCILFLNAEIVVI